MEHSNADDSDLMDHVLGLVLRKAIRGTDHLGAIEVEMPGVPAEDTAQALLAAGRIISAAYEIGFAVTSGTKSRAAAIMELEAGFPGYRKGSYEAVVEYGCQISG